MRADRPAVWMAFLARVAWLILPVVGAGLCHVAVLKSRILQSLAIPIDGGACWRGRPVLGANKTWRGIIVMTLLTACLTQVQAAAGRRFGGPIFGLTRRYRTAPWIAGGLVGLGYCLGELPNSFVKRRLGILPGQRSTHGAVQDVIDQIDSVAGCLLALRLVFSPRRSELAGAFFLGTAVHIGVDRLLYAIGVKRLGA